MKIRTEMMIALALVWLLITACSGVGAQTTPPSPAQTFNYSVIVDAGSSGSRLHLLRSNSDPAIIDIADVQSFKVTPGLSSYRDNPSQAGQSIQQLINQLTAYLEANHIAHDSWHKLPFSLMATAGMRLLTARQQQAIYQTITTMLATNPEANYLQVNFVNTISGEDEGLYGWLDINYLSKSLGRCEVATIGSLDMGGASTQIAYNVTNSVAKSLPTVNFTINGCSYKVLTQSFLGLGQDQAFATMNKLATKDNCYVVGYNSGLIQGNFNQDQCYNNYHTLTSRVEFESNLKQLSALPKSNEFITYSGSYSTFKFLGLTNTEITAAKLKAMIKLQCSKTYTQLEHEFPADSAVASYCAQAEHLDNLFFDPVNYNLTQHRLTSVAEINGQEIGWPLGAALFQQYAIIGRKSN